MSNLTAEVTRIREILEEGQGGGGEGSSDFSTAQVTVVNDAGTSSLTVAIPFIDTDENASCADIVFNRDIMEREITVPLYKGVAVATASGAYEFEVTSGDAETVESNWAKVYIHGDCVLTVVPHNS